MFVMGKAPLTDDLYSKTKAKWDRATTKIFIDSCLEQIAKGERKNNTLSKKGWRDALAQFNITSGRKYDRIQFKNKWDSLKKEWSIWYNLFQNEIGSDWDNDKNTKIASAEWWHAKQQVNPLYAKYRLEGLPHARELTYLFKNKSATGEFAWPLSTRVLPDDHEGDGESTEGFGAIGLDKSEGSGRGDSDEPNIGVDQGGNVGTGGSIDVTNHNQYISECIGTPRSGDKRKRGEEKVVKKGKTESATIIGQHLKTMTGAVESHTSPIIAKNQDPCSIGAAMMDLHKLTIVVEDADFYGRCCELMMNNAAREVFCSIPDEDHKIIFLKHMAYRS